MRINQAVILGFVLLLLFYVGIASRPVRAAQTEIAPDLLQPAPTGEALYVSFSRPGKIGDIEFDGSDILVYRDRNDDHIWSLYFDGSDVGLANYNLSAFELLADDSILMTFAPRTLTLPGLGQITHNDVVRFIPKNVGNVTRGRFELFLNGFDVGLNANAEAIDALAITPDGRLAVSTSGRFHVPGVNGELAGVGQDVITLSLGQSGDLSGATWQMLAQGADLELDEGAENVSALWIDPDNEGVYLATRSRFAISGLSGNSRDIFIARPGQPGDFIQWDFQLYLRGKSLALKDPIDGLTLAGYPLGPSSPFYAPRRR
jgi:hypothetical protein